MRNQNLCYHLHHMVAGKMEKHCFTALWSWIDPSGSRPIISLVRQWGALGSGVTCRGKTAQCCRRLAPRGLDKLPGLWTLHLFAWYQMPLAWPHFPFPVGLWSHWVPITVAAIIVISSNAPRAFLRAYWLIQLEKSKYRERKLKLVCFCLAYLPSESIPALSSVW